MYGVPTMFIAELNHPDFDKFDLSSLRTASWREARARPRPCARSWIA